MGKSGIKYLRGFTSKGLIFSHERRRKRGITVLNFKKETLEKIKELIDKEPLNVILFYLYYVLELDSKTIQKLTGINSIYSRISNFLKKYNLSHTEKPNNIEIQ